MLRGGVKKRIEMYEVSPFAASAQSSPGDGSLAKPAYRIISCL